MDTIWLKIVAFLVVIAGVIIGILMILPSNEEKPKEPDKTFSQMVQKDKAIINAEPNTADLDLKQADEKPKAETKKPDSVVFYFTELSEIDKIQAERIFATVPTFKSTGRLPTLGYNTMIQSCKQLMQRFSGSIYDYKARRALAQIPKQYWARYRITEEMINLSPFTKQRPNTYPYNPQEDD